VAKPEWGTKRSCPKCGTRFYDLGKNSPLVCIDCAHEWTPEPVLKSKQSPAQAPAPAKKEPDKVAEVEEGADALETDADLPVEEGSAEGEADVEVPDDDDDVSDVVTPPIDDDET